MTSAPENLATGTEAWVAQLYCNVGSDMSQGLELLIQAVRRLQTSSAPFWVLKREVVLLKVGLIKLFQVLIRGPFHHMDKTHTYLLKLDGFWVTS